MRLVETRVAVVFGGRRRRRISRCNGSVPAGRGWKPSSAARFPIICRSTGALFGRGAVLSRVCRWWMERFSIGQERIANRFRSHGSSGRTTHFDMDQVRAMDETKGAATMNLPAEAVQEVVVSRVTRLCSQSLQRCGRSAGDERSGGEDWHAMCLATCATISRVGGVPGGPSDYSRQQYGFGGGGAVIKDKAFCLSARNALSRMVSCQRSSGSRVRVVTLQGCAARPLPTRSTYRALLSREHAGGAAWTTNFNENMKGFVRLSYDNSNQIGPSNSQSNNRNPIQCAGGGGWVGLEPWAVLQQRALRLSEDVAILLCWQEICTLLCSAESSIQGSVIGPLGEGRLTDILLLVCSVCGLSIGRRR